MPYFPAPWSYRPVFGPVDHVEVHAADGMQIAAHVHLMAAVMMCDSVNARHNVIRPSDLHTVLRGRQAEQLITDELVTFTFAAPQD